MVFLGGFKFQTQSVDFISKAVDSILGFEFF